MEIEEIKKILEKPSMAETVLIGLEDEREDYYPAIIEIDEENAKVAYDYNLLAECFAKKFAETGTDFEQAMVDACEWIDYNVMRAIPYWGKHAPVVYMKEEDEEV